MYRSLEIFGAFCWNRVTVRFWVRVRVYGHGLGLGLGTSNSKKLIWSDKLTFSYFNIKYVLIYLIKYRACSLLFTLETFSSFYTRKNSFCKLTFEDILRHKFCVVYNLNTFMPIYRYYAKFIVLQIMWHLKIDLTINMF